MAFHFTHFDGDDDLSVSLDELWKETTPKNTPETRAIALSRIASRLDRADDTWGAISAAQAAGEIYETMGKQSQIGHCFFFVGFSYLELSKYEEAGSSFRNADSAFRLALDDEGRGESLRLLGDTFEEQGDFPAALEAWHEAIGYLKSAARYEPIGVIKIQIGDRQAANGNLDSALESFQEAYRNFQSANDLMGATRAHDSIGQVLMEQGKPMEAMPHFRDAIRLLEYLDVEERLAYAHFRLGCCLEAVESFVEAREYFTLSANANKAAGRHTEYASNQLHLANILQATGSGVEAEKTRVAARAIFEGCGNRIAVVDIDLARARHSLENGEEFEALDILLPAQYMAKEWGLHHQDRHARVHIAEINNQLELFQLTVDLLNSYEDPKDPQDSKWDPSVQVRWWNALASALVALGRMSEARPILEKVLLPNNAPRKNSQIARAYELLARTLEPSQFPQRNTVLAQAVALYLDSGEWQNAKALSDQLLPENHANAVMLLRQADGQLDFLFDPASVVNVETVVGEPSLLELGPQEGGGDGLPNL